MQEFSCTTCTSIKDGCISVCVWYIGPHENSYWNRPITLNIIKISYYYKGVDLGWLLMYYNCALYNHTERQSYNKDISN